MLLQEDLHVYIHRLARNIDTSVFFLTLIPLPRPAIAVHPQRPTPWEGIPPLTSASTHPILAIASHPPRQLHPTEIRQTPRHADACAQKTIDYGAEMHVSSQSRQLRGGGREGGGRIPLHLKLQGQGIANDDFGAVP